MIYDIKKKKFIGEATFKERTKNDGLAGLRATKQIRYADIASQQRSDRDQRIQQSMKEIERIRELDRQRQRIQQQRRDPRPVPVPKTSPPTIIKPRKPRLRLKAYSVKILNRKPRQHSEETKAIMSATRKGRKHSEATKARMRAAAARRDPTKTGMAGRKHSEETKAKMRKPKPRS